jgi:hypothetical protein
MSEIRLKKTARKEEVSKSECFVLRAAALYRNDYSGKPPKPGQFTRLTVGQLRAARESVNAALRRGAIRLIDAKEELAVLDAALEVLNQVGPGTVPCLIGEEPFRIREPRKKGSTSKRKKKKR